MADSGLLKRIRPACIPVDDSSTLPAAFVRRPVRPLVVRQAVEHGLTLETPDSIQCVAPDEVRFPRRVHSGVGEPAGEHAETDYSVDRPIN